MIRSVINMMVNIYHTTKYRLNPNPVKSEIYSQYTTSPRKIIFPSKGSDELYRYMLALAVELRVEIGRGVGVGVGYGVSHGLGVRLRVELPDLA